MAASKGHHPAVTTAANELEKPRLRGVLHNFAAVAAITAGWLLTLDAHTADARFGAVVYALSVAGMFTISAAYHRPSWSPRAKRFMRRLDHAGIFLLIAGTYTPLCLIGLDSQLGRLILWRVWLGAIFGMLHSLLTLESRSSKIVAAAVYVALGWTVLPYAGKVRQVMPPGAAELVLAGGIVYSLGAVVYAARWPDPYPRVWGFHEVFHLFICIAALLHFIAVRSVVRRAAGIT